MLPKSNIQNSEFSEYAKKILNGTNLYINNNLFNIVEIEFYLYNDDHKDICVHKTPEQLR
jgi:hypothetical protein